MQTQSQDLTKKVVKTKIKWVLWVAVLLWMTFIFCFSAQNGTQSAQLSEMAQQYIVKLTGIPPAAQGVDYQFVLRKTAHFSVYLVLGILCVTALLYTPKPTRMAFKAALAIAISAGYAVTDELHQSFVAGRAARAFDVGIDTAGACCGMIIVLLIAGHYRKKQQQKEQKQG